MEKHDRMPLHNSLLTERTRRGMSVGTAVFIALYGLPTAGSAQQISPLTSGKSTDDLQEITVTANRREQKLEAVPYALSVVSADQLVEANVSDLASLSANVPGLSLYDAGFRVIGPP